MDVKPQKIWMIAAAVAALNAALFSVKLYIGLASNSVAVFSDAVNNLFDCLGATLTAVSLLLIKRDLPSRGSAVRTEQLLTFILSTAVFAAGAYFAYSSVERFMYPSPVWYTGAYLFALSVTACLKLAAAIGLTAISRRAESPVVRIMAFDSLLDFFITAVTILTLILSSYRTFSFDAAAGLLIGVVIAVGAVKSLMSSARALTDRPAPKEREAFDDLMRNGGIETIDVDYFAADGRRRAYVTVARIPDDAGALTSAALDAGIELIFIASEKGEQNE